MNLREGTRRVALLLGVARAILGGFASYSEFQTVREQWASHSRFEHLAASPVAQQARHSIEIACTQDLSFIKTSYTRNIKDLAPYSIAPTIITSVMAMSQSLSEPCRGVDFRIRGALPFMASLLTPERWVRLLLCVVRFSGRETRNGEARRRTSPGMPPDGPVNEPDDPSAGLLS